MTPFNNPRIYLANLVKFEYDKENKEYFPLILNAKIPVVFILGSGYFTELSNVFNNKYSLPLNIVDLNNFGKVKTYKYYITNANPLRRYTEDENDFLNNLNLNIYKINNMLNCDGNWYKKEDITLDKGFFPIELKKPDFKMNDELYVGRMASRIKKFQNVDGYLSKDEYIHISKNYGLFTYENGEFKSKLTDISYKELNMSDLNEVIRRIDVDKQYSLVPMYSREDIGLVDVYDIHELCVKHNLYIDPKASILSQINSYKGLEKNINIRNENELKNIDNLLEINGSKLNLLNNEIMKRTLRKN